MQQNRRAFLKQAGLGLSAAFLSPYFLSCQGNKSGDTPFHELGLQLYTIRDLLDRDPIKTLNTVAKIGYQHVETFASNVQRETFWGLSVTDLKKVLDDQGLNTHSGHYEMSQYLNRQLTTHENIEKHIEIAHLLGQSYIIAPITPMDDINALTTQDYQYAAEQLNKAGEMAQKAGIKIGYHNHFWELRRFGNGTRGLDILLAFTEPELVSFELDLFWIEKAGLSPQSYFDKYPGRFPLWHLKDMDRQFTQPIVGEGYDESDFLDIMEDVKFTEVGTGAIDFKKIAAEADKAGLKFAFVEQDDIYMPNQFESIKKSYDYVKKHLAT